MCVIYHKLHLFSTFSRYFFIFYHYFSRKKPKRSFHSFHFSTVIYFFPCFGKMLLNSKCIFSCFCMLYMTFFPWITHFFTILKKKIFFLSKILFLPKLPFRRNGRQKKAVEENIKNFRILFSSFWILILARTSLHFNFFSTKKKFFFCVDFAPFFNQNLHFRSFYKARKPLKSKKYSVSLYASQEYENCIKNVLFHSLSYVQWKLNVNRRKRKFLYFSNWTLFNNFSLFSYEKPKLLI